MSATVSRRALERHAFLYEPVTGGLEPGITLAERRRRRAPLVPTRRWARVLDRLRGRGRAVGRS